MKPASLDAADSIYACSNNQQVSARIVRHNLVSTFVSLLREMEKKMDTEDSYLDSILRPLRAFRYRIASLPLPLSSSDCIPADLPNALSVLVPKCKHIFPAYFADLEETAEAAWLVMGCTDAPLLDAIRDELAVDGAGSGTAILIRRQLNASLRNELRRRLGRPRIEIVTPFALHGTEVFSSLIAVGPLGWFPPYVRTAPRAHRLTAVHYEWLRDQQLRPAFASSPDDLLRRGSARSDPGLGDSVIGDGIISFDDSAPTLDWLALHTSNVLGRDLNIEGELASAHLLILSGNMAVYIDSASDAKAQVIDISEDDPVVRILNEELEPGMFVLLRTGGGGDLIVPVADTILGTRAQEVRARQHQWKSKLAALVSQQGERSVIRALQDLGCQRANTFNLRNWMSDKSIRPELDDDFLSVLLLCNLDSEFKTFVANARLLDRVHRRAGFKIRRMLLDRVTEANMSKLSAEGMMEFDLPGLGGGSFTAYRIEEISPETFTVPITYLYHPFEAGAQWLG
ncbi:hypothetical protein NRY68_06805 [Acidithiobacillus ferrooxidans]|uniref:hypothetical protein n=1 Tax=Acidithiobacillus ferrooxidans TaxID=920 RepID=UPI002148FA2A|nr:hypothetical protein [Acidithiobacillus ferrooxidans]MCR1345517.1 hypothetical protein [Acidithiobacillus ferrooxidans]MCR1355787.1 hypothetical protein [Acidithiobacillus ferrooxidans]